MMKLSHEVLLALAYVSQISDPDLLISRFIESMNGLDEGFAFEFVDRLPPGVSEHRVLPIATLHLSFGYAVMAESTEYGEDERAVFRNAFQFLAVLLENRIQAQVLESKNVSLLREIKQEKSLLRTVLDTLPVGVWVVDEKGAILMRNAADEKIWTGAHDVGIDHYGEYKARWSDTGKDIEMEDWGIVRAIRAVDTVINQEIDIECLGGKCKTILHSAAPLLNVERSVIGAVCVNQDITGRKRAEEELRASEAFNSAIVENISQKLFLKNRNSIYLFVNKSYAAIFGLKPENFVGKNDFDFFPDELAKKYRADDLMVMESGLEKDIEETFIVDGKEYLVRTIKAPVRNDAGEVTSLLGIFEDIAQQKKMQEQFIQAQKMESVGLLAGGVAHDFNNMLSIILGYAEMAMDQVEPTEPIHANLQEICKAANCSADLTRQLLAFARKQTIVPKVLDLNETVEGMLKMLRRLIGEDVDFIWQPKASLWPLKIDPSQIDQILANLCVNARDAISGIGKVTIETGNSTFDQDYCAANFGFTPGEYVMLTISDNGCGMDKETLTHIFEPFFTTKEMGRGTGLGLATVYGIVKQNNGFINIYSEPGQGTTFRIYLPRHVGKTDLMQKADLVEPAARGHETILLVEDDPVILKMTKMMLEKQGYTVLAANTPVEAIRLAGEHLDKIHLLITDVIMPEMNGPDLAKNILPFNPNIKHLFMSGYTANVIAHHGVLDVGVHFIQKPFSKQDITAKVRDALDKANG